MQKTGLNPAPKRQVAGSTPARDAKRPHIFFISNH